MFVKFKGFHKLAVNNLIISQKCIYYLHINSSTVKIYDKCNVLIK